MSDLHQMSDVQSMNHPISEPYLSPLSRHIPIYWATTSLSTEPQLFFPLSHLITPMSLHIDEPPNIHQKTTTSSHQWALKNLPKKNPTMSHHIDGPPYIHAQKTYLPNNEPPHFLTSEPQNIPKKQPHLHTNEPPHRWYPKYPPKNNHILIPMSHHISTSMCHQVFTTGTSHQWDSKYPLKTTYSISDPMRLFTISYWLLLMLSTVEHFLCSGATATRWCSACGTTCPPGWWRRTCPSPQVHTVCICCKINITILRWEERCPLSVLRLFSTQPLPPSMVQL